MDAIVKSGMEWLLVRRIVLLAALCMGNELSWAESSHAHRAERAYVGVYLKTIRALNLNEGTFEADLLLWVRWRTSNRLDPSGIGVDNALSIRRELLGVEVKGPWTRKLWRIQGTFYGRFDLKNYPFDRQNLTITIAHPLHSASDLRLEPDIEGSGVALELEIPGTILDHRFSIFQEVTPRLAGGDLEHTPEGSSQVHFRIFLDRALFFVASKVFIPLLLVLVLGYASCWIEPRQVGTRWMLVSFSVCSAVFLHCLLRDVLPSSKGLSIAERYVFLLYAALLGLILSTAVLHAWFVQERLKAVSRLDRSLRWGGPPLLAIGLAVLSVPWQDATAPLRVRPDSPIPELVIGTAQQPKSLGPGAESGIERFLTGLFLRPLAGLDDHWGLRPELAEFVPSFANGGWQFLPGGGASVRWTLRPEARWADGVPITSADFLATQARFPFRNISRIEPTENGVVLFYEQPRPDVLYDVFLLPSHLLQELSAEDSPEWIFRKMPALTGPFRLVRWSKGQELLLERVENFCLGPPSLERIRVLFFENKQELMSAVRRSKVHLVPQGDLTPQEAKALSAEVPSMRAEIADSTVVWHLEVNLEDPILSDARVRRALLLGMDRESMIREVANGEGEVAHSWLPVQHEGYDVGLPHVPYDPQEAGRLLEEAGYGMGADGWRHGLDSKPLRLSIAALPSRRAELEFIARCWRPLGIDTSLIEVPYEKFLGDYTRHRQFPQLAFYGYVATPYETGRKRWDREQIPSARNGWAGENLTGWNSSEVTDLVRALETTFNSEQRVELWSRQQQLWAEELPILPLYTTKSSILANGRLRNIRPHPSERAFLSWNAEDWTFEP